MTAILQQTISNTTCLCTVILLLGEFELEINWEEILKVAAFFVGFSLIFFVKEFNNKVNYWLGI